MIVVCNAHEQEYMRRCPRNKNKSCMNASYHYIFLSQRPSSSIYMPSFLLIRNLSDPSASPPLQPPSGMLEVIRSKVTLDDWPKIDVQNTRITVRSGALRPLEICSAALYSNVVFDLRTGACKTAGKYTLHMISMFYIFPKAIALTVFPAFSLQKTCVYVSSPLFPFKFTSPT